MISGPVSLTNCRRCGQLILSGYSEGCWAQVDPAPIDAAQELQAILAGLATYDVQPLGLPRRPFVWHRTSFRILGARKWAVVAEHRCPPGPHHPPPPSQPIELVIPFNAPTPDQPPF
ncbi:hypothetical protein ITP53_47895 [Nonomuraea sp. K274]|uniref:Uncharacterized protein n=1 Tax=Nonomuraea cypriaca TaxID=1187855 RepID=A0A931F534_9ACTN|nr:hypothetical protein [Nonomuraea cypriaca]MBF8193267.1 hypothetical protein [Nonomuraea cypriaca]